MDLDYALERLAKAEKTHDLVGDVLRELLHLVGKIDQDVAQLRLRIQDLERDAKREPEA